VVISIDPRRVYVQSPGTVPHHVIETALPGPQGERYCWYQCTIKGGREGRPVDAVTLARVCEKLGAGEILLNCIDRDGTNAGFDLELINAVKKAVSIPVIGNGDICSYADGLAMMAETGCDAVMIGRAALGNPWIFQPDGRPESLAGRLPLIRRYTELAEEHLDTVRLLARIKHHTCRFFSGLHGAAGLRQEIIACASLAEMQKLLPHLRQVF
jgi:tRNA-dihydrouridine synthase